MLLSSKTALRMIDIVNKKIYPKDPDETFARIFDRARYKKLKIPAEIFSFVIAP